jgi:hypothetical protein
MQEHDQRRLAAPAIHPRILEPNGPAIDREVRKLQFHRKKDSPQSHKGHKEHEDEI